MSTTPGTTDRLDSALVRRGLARSRGQARELIDTGRVRVDGVHALKPGGRVGVDVELSIDGDPPRWVGRGAEKLAAALARWSPELAVQGRRAADIGAGTGGFTQVLLEAGVAAVAALDVGHGQLASSITDDPRVTDLSGTSVRGVEPEVVGGVADLLVVDLSFISLGLVVSDLMRLAADEADLVLLVKPQFEVGRPRLGKHGIVADPADRAAALRSVLRTALRGGLQIRDLMASPVSGTHGNHEYLVWLTNSQRPVGRGWQAVEDLISDVTRTQT